jgi:hypothetical protein
MTPSVLAMSGDQHLELIAHLLPADGQEAAAILLCGQGLADRPDFLVHDILPIPLDECEKRAADRITWPGSRLAEAQARAEDEATTLVLIHSHPGGYFAFSEMDDASDQMVMASLFSGWCGVPPTAIGSAIIVPGGAIRARAYMADGKRFDLAVRVVGDDILHFWPDGDHTVPMAFGDAMTSELARRRACVIGVSGTGSIAAEQLARLGFGAIALIDFDHIENKNLNRILNATTQDADEGRLKVEMFAEAIHRHRPRTEVTSVAESILSRAAVTAAASSDVIFSCVDSAEGRQIADLVAQAFMIPLIDMGVSLPTRRIPDEGFAIADVLGRVDYVQPGRSTLGSRQVYTAEALRAEYLARVAPDVHAKEQAEGYIKGAPQEAPAVIALNMRAASTAVLEYIARAFPFRHEPNRNYARTLFSVAAAEEEYYAEGEFKANNKDMLGVGARDPLLGLPMLGDEVQ